MSSAARPWIIYGSGSVLLIGAVLFLAYVTGWPANPDQCMTAGGNCYCELFSEDDVRNGARGIRQPVNTWSNLYALITAGIVAFVLSRDRAQGASGNLMKSDSPIADAYVFAVLFLGLGSMWFHASISASVAWMDGLSMYVYAGFLVFYTLDRLLAKHGVAQLVRTLVFWIAWPVTAIVLTIVGAAGADSMYLIIALVAVYVVLELIVGWLGWKDGRAAAYWLFGLGAMAIAVTFWVLSGDEQPLCTPESLFQPHGMIWHTFAGVMAVLMFFYWRREGTTAQQWQ